MLMARRCRPDVDYAIVRQTSLVQRSKRAANYHHAQWANALNGGSGCLERAARLRAAEAPAAVVVESARSEQSAGEACREDAQRHAHRRARRAVIMQRDVRLPPLTTSSMLAKASQEGRQRSVSARQRFVATKRQPRHREVTGVTMPAVALPSPRTFRLFSPVISRRRSIATSHHCWSHIDIDGMNQHAHTLSRFTIAALAAARARAVRMRSAF